MPLPMDVTIRAKACKMCGLFCTPTLGYKETSFCEEFNVQDTYGNSACPSPGTYSFNHKVAFPNNHMTDWAYNGLSFRINLNFHADDTGNDFTKMNCYAQFTAVDFDSDSYSDTSYGAATVGIVALLGVGAYAGFQERRRRLRSPAIDLNGFTDADSETPYTNAEAQDESVTVAMEMMGYHSRSDGDFNSVRV